MERGKLVGAGGVFAFWQLAADNNVSDSSCQLLINRPGVTHYADLCESGIEIPFLVYGFTTYVGNHITEGAHGQR